MTLSPLKLITSFFSVFPSLVRNSTTSVGLLLGLAYWPAMRAILTTGKRDPCRMMRDINRMSDSLCSMGSWKKKKRSVKSTQKRKPVKKRAEFSLESSRRKARRSLRLEVETPCQPPHQPVEHEAYQSKSKVNPTTQTYASQH